MTTATSDGSDSLTAHRVESVVPRAPTADASTRGFGHATTARRVALDRFVADVDDSWRVLRGPNGGYLAALLLQTMTTRLDDAARRPRVLSLHYPGVPHEGQVEIRTELTRTGRTMSWIAGELWQDEKLCVAARSAFSGEWPSIEIERRAPPAAPPLESGIEMRQSMPPFGQHFDYRSLYATPAGSNGSDAVGGYIRPRVPQPYGPALIAAMADAWFPSTVAFERRPVMAATIDLTVHFRDYAALGSLAPTDFVHTIFRTRLATEGFFEEDGELWTRDGRLIAQSRQLAVATPYG